MRDDLLRAQGDALGLLGGDRQRLVVAGEGERLDAAEHRGEGLKRRPHDVVLGLLGGEGGAAGLHVGAKQPGFRVLGAEALAHEPGPHATQRPVLRHLLEEGVVAVEDPGDARGQLVHVVAALLARLQVGDGVRECEGDLLRRGGAGVPDVVAADADRVELRRVSGAVGEQVRRQSQRRPWRVDVGAAGDVLLQHVVLGGAHDLCRSDALLLGNGEVERDHHRRRRVDRHRGAHLVEGDAFEHHLHVLEGVDGDAYLANLGLRQRVVGVVADLGGQVEGDGEAGLALREEELEALVRLLRRAEAGILAHAPEPAAIHRGLHASGEGVFARVADVALVVRVLDIERGVEPVDRPRAGLELGVAFAGACQHGLQHALLPLPEGVRELLAMTVVRAVIAHAQSIADASRREHEANGWERERRPD